MPKKSYISKKQWKKQWKEYKKNLPHYATIFKPSKLARDFVNLLKKHRLVKGDILEIGCGNGRDSFFFARQGFDTTGFDISPEAIKFCKERQNEFIKNKKAQIKFLAADAEKLPFRDESFIGAYSVGVLHSTNLKKSLKELSRVMKKGGLVMVHLFEKTVFLPSKKVEQNYSAKEIKNILAKFPFKILKFASNLTRSKPDYDEKAGFHKHFSVIMSLEKIE